MSAEKVLYTAKAHTTGGREGASKTDDGRLDLKLTSPGAKGDGTNPEQLFAVGWSACYIGALQAVARRGKLTMPANTSVDIEIDLCQGGDEYFLRARMTVNLPGMDRTAAQAMAESAHKVCPYSKATHGNVAVETKVKV